MVELHLVGGFGWTFLFFSVLKDLFDCCNRLNEGYATVFEYLLVDREYPELRMNELFSAIKVQGAFRPDSLESTHPMTYNGQTQSLIIYDKGIIHGL